MKHFLNFISPFFFFFNCHIVQEPETITDNAPTALGAVQMNPKDDAVSEIKTHIPMGYISFCAGFSWDRVTFLHSS